MIDGDDVRDFFMVISTRESTRFEQTGGIHPCEQMAFIQTGWSRQSYFVWPHTYALLVLSRPFISSFLQRLNESINL